MSRTLFLRIPDAKKGKFFHLGLHLDEEYIEGFVEGCLERIGEDGPEEGRLFRGLFEDEIQREVVIESLKADCDVRTGTGLRGFEVASFKEIRGVFGLPAKVCGPSAG